ncbi:MAG: PqqD family peptide modification chaperone [Bryobacteraceae bacterium]
MIYQLFDEEIVAIHIASGTYHSLTGIAGEAFLCLGVGGATRSDVAAALALRYDAPAETIERDLERYFAKLEEEMLIAPVDPAPPFQPPPANGHARIAYNAPQFQTHRDLQQLFLLDPVHDVAAEGWPNVAPAAAAGGAGANLECRYAGSHIIFEKMPEETVAMNVGTGAYHSLSGPAEDVFLLLEHAPSVDELIAALAAKYEAPRAEIEDALRDFLNTLGAAGLIVMQPAGPGRESRDLTISRPGTGLAFSRMQLESFQDAPAPVDLSQDAGQPAQGRFRLRHEDLLAGSAGGESVVADREFGNYYRLNQPSSDVFVLLRQQAMSTQEITAALLRKYDVNERNLTCGVMILLRNLVRVNLLVYEPGEPRDRTVVPDLPAPSTKVAFEGFVCAIHKDLRSLMTPFNTGEFRKTAPRASTADWFLDSLRGHFEEAAARTVPMVERSLRAGGSLIRLRSIGDTYIHDLAKACSHLEIPTGAESGGLTIHIWDAAVPPSDSYFAAALERLFVDWPRQCGPRGEVTGIDGGRLAAIYHPGPDVLSVVDKEAGQAYFLKRDQSPLPYWEIGSPFRYVFHSWFASRGQQFIHGGAVGTADGGVLLAGKGGSGKSTTTMLCAADGMSFAGDDYCLADPATGFLSSLYNTGKLTGPEDLTRVPAMAGRSRNADSFENGGTGKGIYFLSEVWPERISSGFPLRAILIPSVTGESASRLEPCAKGDALLALLPSTVAQLPAADHSDCERMARLVERLPAYYLHLGKDTAQIPGVVRSALR